MLFVYLWLVVSIIVLLWLLYHKIRKTNLEEKLNSEREFWFDKLDKTFIGKLIIWILGLIGLTITYMICYDPQF